ncbi:MAG: hypothetical protein AAF495_16705 [Pseudomonadota bacterium]
MENSDESYLAVGDVTRPEPSDADVGAGARLGQCVALLLMVVLISLALCCLG